jgi:uncharacterized cupin superfamily protein
VVPEAPLERTETGVVPTGGGWFVVNVADARWYDSTPLGFYCPFEGQDARFADLGVNIGVLRPGEAGGMYHGEEMQEGFLVLAGECVLIVEGEERRLRAWDFFHCPPWTEHGFVGTGDGPCVILAVGARRKGRGIVYPVNEIALKHGVGVSEETREPAKAYEHFTRQEAIRCPDEFRRSASKT